MSLNYIKESQALQRKGLKDQKVINDLIEHKAHTPYTLKKRYPTEMYDKVNLMCRKYMDRLARFEVDYDFIIDEEKFKAVAICLLECFPIMHSKVVLNPITPYWRICDYRIYQMVDYKVVDDIDKTREEFFKMQIPLDSNMQMRIGVYICQGKSYVLFIWNHMLFDGGGFKQFWSDFCLNYTEYDLHGISPVHFSSGSRKYTEVYKDMDKATAKAAKNKYINISPKPKVTMPFINNDKTDDIIIVSREVEAEKFEKAKAFAKENGGTVNDILVTAFIAALGKVSGLSSTDSVCVACATDLRRYIDDLSKVGYTNHVSFIHCELEEKGADFKETFKNVSAKTKELKSDPYMGLQGLPILNVAYKSMVYLQAEAIVKMFYNNPVLSVSNVGQIEKCGFEISNNPPFSAFVAGAAKNKPCAVMTSLTVNGKLSASICLRGNDDDKAVLNKFFDIFKEEIENIQ